jgi:SAM-dependent methyltransferase
MDREQRLVFGEDAELYDRARPHYPSALIDDVVQLIGPAARVIDAGCGTGKASVMLAARGIHGVDLEPRPEMAAIARRHLEGHRGWRIDIAAFEDWTPAAKDPRFDAVVSAQAWHWFKPDVRFQKAHTLLLPGGWLALWWNGPRPFDSSIRRAIDEAYATHAPEIVYRGVAGHWRPSLDPLPVPGSFGPPIERHYTWTASYTSAGWTDLLQTHSDHRMLPRDRREVLLDAVRDAIDANGGTYEHPYVCSLWAAQRSLMD